MQLCPSSIWQYAKVSFPDHCRRNLGMRLNCLVTVAILIQLLSKKESWLRIFPISLSPRLADGLPPACYTVCLLSLLCLSCPQDSHRVHQYRHHLGHDSVCIVTAQFSVSHVLLWTPSHWSSSRWGCCLHTWCFTTMAVRERCEFWNLLETTKVQSLFLVPV